MVARARLLYDSCAACGREPGSVHHVIARGGPYYGDDVQANLIVLCGSGASGCHGAFHGSPYLDRCGSRWDGKRVRRTIGRYLLAHRPDTVAYVLAKLGQVAGHDFLARRYGP